MLCITLSSLSLFFFFSMEFRYSFSAFFFFDFLLLTARERERETNLCNMIEVSFGVRSFMSNIMPTVEVNISLAIMIPYLTITMVSEAAWTPTKLPCSYVVKPAGLRVQQILAGLVHNVCRKGIIFQ